MRGNPQFTHPADTETLAFIWSPAVHVTDIEVHYLILRRTHLALWMLNTPLYSQASTVDLPKPLCSWRTATTCKIGLNTTEGGFTESNPHFLCKKP